MSEQYEAIVVAAGREAVVRALADDPCGLDLEVISLAPRATGIFRIAARATPFAADAIEKLASALSALAPAGAFFYDNRIGLRHAVLFAYGKLERKFGAQDEQWVPLDEQGLPDASVAPVLSAERSAEVEYETVRSAIDLGLVALLGPGSPVTSASLKDVFC